MDFASVARRNSRFVPSRDLLADLATGDPKEISEASFADVEVVRARNSGDMSRDLEDKSFCDGVPTRETLALIPGGTIGAGDEGLDELSGS